MERAFVSAGGISSSAAGYDPNLDRILRLFAMGAVPTLKGD
jgi:hypothetical protein